MTRDKFTIHISSGQASLPRNASVRGASLRKRNESRRRIKTGFSNTCLSARSLTKLDIEDDVGFLHALATRRHVKDPIAAPLGIP